MGKLRHSAKSRGDRSYRYQDIAVFRFSRWPPSAMLDFKNLEILLADRVEMHYIAKFCRNRSISCRDIVFFIFQDGGRPQSWICWWRIRVVSRQTYADGWFSVEKIKCNMGPKKAAFGRKGVQMLYFGLPWKCTPVPETASVNVCCVKVIAGVLVVGD